MAAAARLTLAVVAVALVLSACANRPPHWYDGAASEYVVRRGDTLYSIAFRHGLDWRDVARWNDVRGPRYLIQVGDRLKLTGVGSRQPDPVVPSESRRSQIGSHSATAQTSARAPAPSNLAVKFQWPAVGATTASGKGIAIAGRVGAPISAAAAGRVVYTGSGLIGYGELIIVKHSNQLLSAYAHNDQILVREGDEVSAGQRIATMGEGPGRRAVLHFEIRIDGTAVDPLRYLPSR